MDNYRAAGFFVEKERIKRRLWNEIVRLESLGKSGEDRVANSKLLIVR
jgi:hypothetical protein